MQSGEIMANRLAGVFGLAVFLLTGCEGAFLGIPLTVTATEVVPRAVNGKGLAEDGVDVATGKDGRVIEGAVRKDRQTCEPRGSPETEKDFKGFSGLAGEKGTPNER